MTVVVRSSRLWISAFRRAVSKRRDGLEVVQQQQQRASLGYAAAVREEEEDEYQEYAWANAGLEEQGRGVQWVFLGCPGVGKGTYASRLAKLLQVPHIAMGDLVRQELSYATPIAKQLKSAMSQGQLLPDEVIFRLLSKRLEHGASCGESGFILDGFPRTVNQAKTLAELAEIDMVMNLKLRDDVLVTKCLGRRICAECGGNFNLAQIQAEGSANSPAIFMPPLLPPPKCLPKMTIRADDTEEVVRTRLRLFYEESKPVEDFYRKQGKLLDFEVAGGIPETWQRLLTVLNLEEKNASQSQLRDASRKKMTA